MIPHKPTPAPLALTKEETARLNRLLTSSPSLWSAEDSRFAIEAVKRRLSVPSWTQPKETRHA